jgi:Fe-S cluster assembly iron-binding protein IscA
MPDEAVAQTTQAVTLTDAAAAKAAHLLSTEEPGLALRVGVQPGGCSGLRYQLYFTDEYKHVISWELTRIDDEGFSRPEGEEAAAERALLAQRGDTLTWFGRVPVLVDPRSRPYLPGATLDYLDTLQKSGFTIDNPNAAGSCACGDSFH